LRFMPYCPHRCGCSFPAMVAAVVGIDGQPLGYHATFLAPDGAAKHPFPDKSMQRECRGAIRGGAVRLAPAICHRLSTPLNCSSPKASRPR
jgi:hypothetical protein